MYAYFSVTNTIYALGGIVCKNRSFGNKKLLTKTKKGDILYSVGSRGSALLATLGTKTEIPLSIYSVRREKNEKNDTYTVCASQRAHGSGRFCSLR